MRFVFEPCNNTLSHLAKCLALREVMLTRGHDVFLAVSRARGPFLDRLGVEHLVLPDIQESDGNPSPTFAWFRPARVETTVRAEVAMLRRLRPDRVLGVFRFTGALSAALAGVPYDSLVCGCITPACTETLGFAPGEPFERQQYEALRFFRQACVRRIGPLLDALGLPPANDLWQLLLGERTFLWDIPELQPLQPMAGLRHVGPIRWAGWPRPHFDQAAFERLRDPVAYVTFGTGGFRAERARRIVAALQRLGFSAAVGAGGPFDPRDWPASSPDFAIFELLPAEVALERARVMACHGGQGILFEAMRRAVPALVLPFQPEQMQNGRCVERLGCGLRLARSIAFPVETPAEAGDGFLEMPLGRIAQKIEEFLDDPKTRRRCAEAAEIVRRYDGLASLASLLETMP